MNTLLLIVEENDAIRKLLREWLEVTLFGCRVLEATNSEEAIALTRTQSPRAILMGIDSLGASSIEAIRQVKIASPTAKVIALTADDHRFYHDDVIAAGAGAYVNIWKIRTELLPALKTLLAVENESSVSL